MRDPRFWIPFGISLFLTLAVGLVAAGSISSGAGNYLPVLLLFPFAMLLTSFLDLHFGYLIGIALLQFPIYGAVLGKGNLNGHFARTAFAILLIHGTAVGLVLLLARQGSW
jgi:hypothetical protein